MSIAAQRAGSRPWIAALALLLLAALAAAQTVYDKGTSGVNDDGTLMGTATFDPDARYGANSVRLPPGDANRVQIQQPATDLDFAGGYTYMCWFKNVSPGQKGLIGLGNCCTAGGGGDPRNGYTMNITSHPQIRYWAGSTANNSNYNLWTPTTPAINDGSWHHCAIRVQPGTVQILFDGTQVASGSVSNLPTDVSRTTPNALSTNVPKIGGDGISESSTATTLIDEVRIYGSFLSNQQVQDAMNNIGPMPDRLFWDFEPPAEMRVRTVDTAEVEVYWGQTGIPVTVTVENTGTIDINTLDVILHFTDSGMNNVDAEYTVTPDPGNPTTLAVGVTETLSFTVDVSMAPTVDTITLDAEATGVAAVGGTPVSDPDADTPDSWDVRICPSTTCGDCNNDGMIDIVDALAAAQHGGYVITLTGRDFSNCNVAGAVEPDPAAAVNILDALMIAQYSVPMPVTLTCC